MFYLFLTRFLPFLLDRKDRMSMAVGFEVRVPFCDYRLVEYLWNVPFNIKSIDNIEKGILRRALQPALPDDVRNRRKSAYPTSQDPHYLQTIRNLTLDMCSNKTILFSHLLTIPSYFQLLIKVIKKLTILKQEVPWSICYK